MSKGSSEEINRRTANGRCIKGQTMVYKSLHSKLKSVKIEQQWSHISYLINNGLQIATQ